MAYFSKDEEIHLIITYTHFKCIFDDIATYQYFK